MSHKNPFGITFGAILPSITEEEELYHEVEANYEDFGIGRKKPAVSDAEVDLAQVMELNQETKFVETPLSLLDPY